MAYVKCKYCAEEWNAEIDAVVPVDKYIAGEYKRVSWNGETLCIGNRQIHSHSWFERVYREHGGYMGGIQGIDYLEIEGIVYIGGS